MRILSTEYERLYPACYCHASWSRDICSLLCAITMLWFTLMGLGNSGHVSASSGFKLRIRLPVEPEKCETATG